MHLGTHILRICLFLVYLTTETLRIVKNYSFLLVSAHDTHTKSKGAYNCNAFNSNCAIIICLIQNFIDVIGGNGL